MNPDESDMTDSAALSDHDSRSTRPESISISGVTHTYSGQGRRSAVYTALENVDLSIRQSEFVCLLGPSGCGKTTLMNCVAGFFQPTTGSITVDGEQVMGPSRSRGVVFQNHALLPWYTAAENIALGPRMAGMSKKRRREIAAEHLAMVGLGKFADKYPGQLSGGMAQRVGIARALANDPSVLLMDEPFGALDAITRESMQEQLVDLWKLSGATAIFVTHSVQESVYLADRVVVMSATPGRIAAEVSIDLERPRDRTSSEFAEFARKVDRALRDAESASSLPPGEPALASSVRRK